MGEEELILHHRYGVELKAGMRVDVARTPGVYRLRRIDTVRVDMFNQNVELTLSDGSIIETSVVSSWYVEAR